MSLEHLLNTVAASLDRRLDSREMLGAVLDRLYSEGLSITRNGDAQRNHLVASIEKLKAWMASLAVDERPRDEKGFASLESRGEWSRVLTRLHRLETQIGAMQDCRLKTLLIKLHVPSITLGDDKIAGPFLQVRSDGGVKMLEEILGECYFLEKHRYDPLRSTGSVSAEVAAQKDPVLVGYDRITRPSAKFIIDTITKAVRALNAAHDTTRQETVERMIDES